MKKKRSEKQTGERLTRKSYLKLLESDQD